MAQARESGPVQGPHKLVLDEGARLSVTGVSQVLSFDENAVTLETARGLLQVRGKDLKLRALAPEGGQVDIAGQVELLAYEEARPAGGLFRRLWGG